MRLSSVVLVAASFGTACGGADADLGGVVNGPTATEAQAAAPTEAPATPPVTAVARRIPGPLSVEGRWTGELIGLTPDGAALVIARTPTDVCVYLPPNQIEDFCFDQSLDDDVEREQQVLGAGGTIAWASDNQRAAYSPRWNLDASLFDLSTRTIRNLNHDGVWDISALNFDIRPVLDLPPSWLEPDETLVFLHRPIDDSPNLKLAVLDVASTEITTRIELPFPQTTSFRVLVEDPETVYVAGDSSVYRVNIQGRLVTEVADFLTTYSGSVPGIEPSGNLDLIALLPNDELLVGDPLITSAALNQGQTSGGTSGLYFLDTEDGALVPVFAPSPVEAGWIGPTAVWISPDNQTWLVQWIDDTSPTDDRAIRPPTISVINPASESFPLTPRDLPVVWSADLPDTLRWIATSHDVLQTWADNNTIAVTTVEDETLLLQVP